MGLQIFVVVVVVFSGGSDSVWECLCLCEYCAYIYKSFVPLFLQSNEQFVEIPSTEWIN